MSSKAKIYFWVVGFFVVISAVFFFFKFFRKNIEISNGNNQTAKAGNNSQITGLPCQGGGNRPYAVMVSSDKEARPLSGLAQADLVFEMPVVDSGFTRMMAVFQCSQPDEIGSVRSSRLDFVPLALGINAIYAHFGGEHSVLEELNSGIIDNIDGLKYDGTIYYRKNNIPKPHNAFTSFDLLSKASKLLGYQTQLQNPNPLFDHEAKENPTDPKTAQSPESVYNQDFRVVWSYDSKTNSYFRTRSGLPETDKISGKQVSFKNIVIMSTTWSPINKDYIRVATVGSGKATFYFDGKITTGSWRKNGDKDKLFFLDQNGKQIKFAPGSIWVEIST